MFFLSSIQLFSQSYLNIHFSDGSFKYSAIGSLQKITVNEMEGLFNFYIDDDSIVSENIGDIKKFSIDLLPLGQPLPVELSSFSISVDCSSVCLKWRTETEVNNFGFDIERTTGSGTAQSGWNKIGFVAGSGNTNSFKEYSFTDTPPLNKTYHYRLKQVDADGKYSYSNVLSIDLVIPVQLELKQNFPNPFNPSTFITYHIQHDGFVSIKIFDIMGSEVSTLINENQKAGSYSKTFDGSDFASGFYICRMICGNFTHSIKMLLLK